MQKITFLYNWNNKLFCDVFTTFRMRNPSKFKIGSEFMAELYRKDILILQKPVKLLAAAPFLLYSVPQSFCWLDSGYSKDQFIKVVTTMYKNKNIDFNTAYFCFYFFGPMNMEPIQIS